MEEYLKLQQLAEKLKLNARTLYQLQKKPGFPRLKIGRSVRYKFTDVEKWLIENQTEELKTNDNKDSIE